MKNHAWMILVVTSACAIDAVEDGRDDSFADTDGKADTGGLANNSPEALAVLRVANERSDVEMRNHGVPTLASQNIVATRTGDDAVSGTSDDVVFASLQELDAVAYVGPLAFARLLAYADELGYLSPPASPSVVAPADLWHVAACSPMKWSQLVAKFGAGETFHELGKEYGVATRRRAACNTFTGCAPWSDEPVTLSGLNRGTNDEVWYGSREFRSTTGGSSTIHIDQIGSIDVSLETWVQEERLGFQCQRFEASDAYDIRCAPYAIPGGDTRLPMRMYDEDYALSLDGNFCADGRFHFTSHVPNDGSQSASNLQQLSIYGRLF